MNKLYGLVKSTRRHLSSYAIVCWVNSSPGQRLTMIVLKPSRTKPKLLYINGFRATTSLFLIKRTQNFFPFLAQLSTEGLVNVFGPSVRLRVHRLFSLKSNPFITAGQFWTVLQKRSVHEALPFFSENLIPRRCVISKWNKTVSNYVPEVKNGHVMRVLKFPYVYIGKTLNDIILKTFFY